MTAFNINVEEFLKILVALKQKGVKMMNLDMLPDESNPKMNKLVIHPSNKKDSYKESEDIPENLKIVDPDIDIDNDDISNLFNGLV